MTAADAKNDSKASASNAPAETASQGQVVGVVDTTTGRVSELNADGVYPKPPTADAVDVISQQQVNAASASSSSGVTANGRLVMANGGNVVTVNNSGNATTLGDAAHGVTEALTAATTAVVNGVSKVVGAEPHLTAPVPPQPQAPAGQPAPVIVASVGEQLKPSGGKSAAIGFIVGTMIAPGIGSVLGGIIGYRMAVKDSESRNVIYLPATAQEGGDANTNSTAVRLWEVGASAPLNQGGYAVVMMDNRVAEFVVFLRRVITNLAAHVPLAAEPDLKAFAEKHHAQNVGKGNSVDYAALVEQVKESCFCAYGQSGTYEPYNPAGSSSSHQPTTGEHVAVTCPPSALPGSQLLIQHDNKTMLVTVPVGAVPGGMFLVPMPAADNN